MPSPRSPSAAAAPSSLRAWLVGLALFAGTLALFARALPYGFLNYDDPAYVTNNAHVQAGLTWDGVVWAFTGDADYWHPLTWLSHMVDRELFGDAARGHRFTSLLWHAANAVLLFSLLRRWTGAFWTSACAAAVFAWHPLRVESVVWVTERKDVMSGAFFLLTLAAHTHYAAARAAPEAAGRGRAWRWYLATLGLFAAGLAAKPMLVALPLVLLVVDFWPLRRAPLAPDRAGWTAWRPLLVEKVPFFALAALVSWLTVRMQHAAGAFTLELSFDARVGNALVSLVRYLGKFVWPFDLTLVYPHPGRWPWWALAGAAAVLGGLGVVAWRQRTARPWILAGALWYVVVLGPALGLVQSGFQAMADRYSYLSLLGVELAVLWTVRAWWVARPRPGFAIAVAAVLLLGGLAARTWSQQAVWRDPVALFEHSLRVTERNEVAHGFLAYTLLGERRPDEARPHALRAVEINPRNTVARFVLAELAEGAGRPDEAADHYRRVLEITPRDATAGYRLGMVLLQHGRPAEAEPVLDRVVRENPGVVVAQLALADAIARQGRVAEATARYEAVLAAHPGVALGHNNFAILLAVTDRADDAARHFAEAVRLSPDDPVIRVNFADYFRARRDWPAALEQYARAVTLGARGGAVWFGLAQAQENTGRTGDAETSFRHALAAAPDEAAVHRAWGDALAKRRRFDETVAAYGNAVRLEPDNASHHAALGYALMVLGRRDEAAAQWEEALRLDPAFPDLRRRLEQLRR